MALFNGFSNSRNPTSQEIFVDILVLSAIKIVVQQLLSVTVFRTPYLQELIMGAPRWSYLANVLVQAFCFIPFGIYALLQYDTLDSFFDCTWETYALPHSRFYGYMIITYMIRDILNCLYSTDLILHHAAGAFLTTWAMLQPCSLEIYLAGVSALEIGSLCNNIGVLSEGSKRQAWFFRNNFIFLVGHIIAIFFVYKILMGNAETSYRYVTFFSTVVICIVRSKAIYAQYKEGLLAGASASKKSK